MSIEQRAVLRNLPKGNLGRILSPPYHTEVINMPFTERTPASFDFTVMEAEAGDYTIVVDGEAVTYTAESSDSVMDIAEGLVDAINDNFIASASVVAEGNQDDTFVLTGKSKLTTYDVSIQSGDLLLTTTDGDMGEAFPVAHPVYADDGMASLEPPEGTSHVDALIGFSAYRYDSEKMTIGGSGLLAGTGLDLFHYAPSDILVILRDGRILVDVPGAKAGMPAYLGVDGDDEHQLFAEDGPDREAVPGLSFDESDELRVKL